MSLTHQRAGAAARLARRVRPMADKSRAMRLFKGMASHVALRATGLVRTMELAKARPAAAYLLRLIAHAVMTMGFAGRDTCRALAMAVRHADRRQVRIYSAGIMRALARTARAVAGAGMYSAIVLFSLVWRAGRFLTLRNPGRWGLEIGLALAVIWLLLTPRERQIQPDATHAAQPVALVQVPDGPVHTAPNPVAIIPRHDGTGHPRTSIESHHLAMPVVAHREQTVTATGLLHGAGGARATRQPCLRPSTPLPPPGPCGDLWRRAEQPNPDGRLEAPPSVSVGAIWHALWAAGSPMAATGARRDGKTYAEYLWDEGKIMGIDPAVVMGFFRHESHYGTLGMARLTHSLGNMRPVGLQPQVCGSDGCYAYANDWFDGIDRMYSLLRQYALNGAATVGQAIPVWAPPSDYNDDTAYVNSVQATMQALHAAG